MTAAPRIVVALDASPDARAAFEAACELARRTGAEVACVFVEDEDVLDLAGHPLARFVGRAGAVPAPIERAAMERSMRHVSGRVAALVQEAAARLRVQATVRTLRGRVVEALIASSSDADLVLVGKGRRGAPAGLARTPAVALGAPRPVLLLGAGEVLGPPVALVDDVSEAGAIVGAASLVADAGGVRMVALGDTPEAAGAVADEARRALAERGIAGAVEAVTRSPQVLEVLAALRGRTLVVGAGAWRRGAFDALVARLKVPVLIAR